MKVKILCSLLLTTIAVGFAPLIFSQTVGNGGVQGVPCTVDSRPPAPPQPYTVEFKITNVQTLADGTKITRESKEIAARDSQGRIFNQNTNPAFLGPSGSAEYVYGFVENPVDGIRINWNSQGKKATVLKMPVGDQRHGCWKSESGNMRMDFDPIQKAAQPVRKGDTTVSAANSPRPANFYRPEDIIHPVIEHLGTATIQGLEARGTRSTITTPVGQIGNDRPMVRIFENWTVKGLGLQVREVTDDPQSGKRTKELVSLTQGEPDPALFQPPEGYEVVNEEMHQVPCDQM